jgi:hypothetical protein
MFPQHLDSGTGNAKMYFIPELDLEIPGFPHELRARLQSRLDAIVEHMSPRQHASRQRTRQDVVSKMHCAATLVNEPQYLQRLQNADASKRADILDQQVLKRFKLVLYLLLWNDIETQRLELVRQLALELVDLRKLVAGLPGEHPLVALLQALANIVRNLSVRLPVLNEQIYEIKELSVQQALESVHIVYRSTKDGTRNFKKQSYCFDFELLEIPGATGVIRELVDALIEAEQANRSFTEPKRRWHQAKADRNKPQFVQRLEQALLKPDPRWSFDDIKRLQESAEALFYTASQELILRSQKLVCARARLQDALQAAYSFIDVKDDHWSLGRAFAQGNEIDAYKAMVNCVCASLLLSELDEKLTEFNKIAPEFKDFDTDPLSFTDAVLAEVLKGDSAPPTVAGTTPGNEA